MVTTESKMTKEDCDRINKTLTRIRKEQGITLGHLIPWWEEVYKDCPTEYPSFIEDRPLILWLRGQLK